MGLKNTILSTRSASNNTCLLIDTINCFTECLFMALRSGFPGQMWFLWLFFALDSSQAVSSCLVANTFFVFLLQASVFKHQDPYQTKACEPKQSEPCQSVSSSSILSDTSSDCLLVRGSFISSALIFPSQRIVSVCFTNTGMMWPLNNLPQMKRGWLKVH